MSWAIHQQQACYPEILTILIVLSFCFFLCSDFHQYNNDTDLGMKSGIGLKPPKISTKELRSPEKSKWMV